MAYEHGSIKLDISNPFKVEGKLQTLTMLIFSLYALWLILGVVDTVKVSRALGWAQLAIAGFALVVGLRLLGQGLMRVFRFYVGRGVPLSLAKDLEQGNPELDKIERKNTRYSAEELEGMLVGRKNSTFYEPQGFISRFIHSILGSLIFLPYIYRNMAVHLGVAIFNSLIVLLSYAIISFIADAGLLPSNSEIIKTVAQWVILLYLLKIWYSAANLDNESIRQIEDHGAMSIAKPILIAVALPLLAGQLFSGFPSVQNLSTHIAEAPLWQEFNGISPTGYLILMIGCGVLVSAVVGWLLLYRLQQAKPVTEVSEYRELWQEDVNPREIFITLETLVLANRRYREIPNRIYKALKPKLQEQSDGKGIFSGDILLETQPAPRQMLHSDTFKLFRLLATIAGSVLILGGFLVLLNQALEATRLINQFFSLQQAQSTNLVALASDASQLVGYILMALILLISGRILFRLVHWFWAELQFESLLLNFKCNGTFRETRFVTGKGVYDSTQSDNQVVRSDITPWVTLTRAVSATFAGIGNLNLEGQRVVLEMHRDEIELQSIIQELLENLGKREKVASIKNEHDLQAIEQINQVNQISRQQMDPDLLSQEAQEKIIPVVGAAEK